MKFSTLIVLIVLGLGGCSFVSAISSPITEQSSVNKETTTKWTIMAYINADCEGERWVLDFFNELEAGLVANGDIEVVVLIDRNKKYDTSNGDWTDARYYHVLPDVEPNIIASELRANLGEVNLGDPKTLRDFVIWSQSEYPAEKQALITVGHGRGVSGILWDEDNNWDHLTLDEVQQAMNGLHIDLLGLDNCVMALLEVAYEWGTFSDYIVASQDTFAKEGSNCQVFLQELVNNPSMTPEEAGESLARTAMEFYRYDWGLTRSVINTSAIPDVVFALSDLSSVLINSTPSMIHRIADLRQEIFAFEHNTVDIGSLIEVFGRNYTDDVTVSNALTALDEAYEGAVLHNFNDRYSRNATGMSVFFPLDKYSLEDWGDYVGSSVTGDLASIDFLADSMWDEFLKGYIEYAPVIQEDTTNYIEIEDNKTYEITVAQEDEVIACKFQVNERGIYNFTLDVEYGDMMIQVLDYYTGTSPKLGYQGFLYSAAQNPDQSNKERIVFWLYSGFYSVYLMSLTPSARGNLTITRGYPAILSLNEKVKGEFPPLRVTSAPIMTIYNYFFITLDSLVYDILVEVSYHAGMELNVYDENHDYIIYSFLGNAGQNCNYTFDNSLGSGRTILIELGAFAGTGNFSLLIIPSSTTSESSSIATPVFEFFIALFAFFVVALFWN
ncbi:MAG: clostripain-related cysteine peptidase, partial [Candidatus Hermodarchaeota archaeon]